MSFVLKIQRIATAGSSDESPWFAYSQRSIRHVTFRGRWHTPLGRPLHARKSVIHCIQLSALSPRGSGEEDRINGYTPERFIPNHPEPDSPQHPLMQKPKVGSVPVPSDWYEIRLFSDVFPTHGGRAHREEAGKIQHVKWMPHQRACSLPETSSERHGRNRAGLAAKTNRLWESKPSTLIRTTCGCDSLNLRNGRHAVVLRIRDMEGSASSTDLFSSSALASASG